MGKVLGRYHGGRFVKTACYLRYHRASVKSYLGKKKKNTIQCLRNYQCILTSGHYLPVVWNALVALNIDGLCLRCI